MHMQKPATRGAWWGRNGDTVVSLVRHVVLPICCFSIQHTLHRITSVINYILWSLKSSRLRYGNPTRALVARVGLLQAQYAA